MSFANELDRMLDDSKQNDFNDNWDHRRFGPLPATGVTRRAKNVANGILATLGIKRKNPCHQIIDSNMDQCEWLYGRLIDDQSKEIMLKVLAYRIMGHRKVKLPLNTAAHWDKIAELESRACNSESLAIDFRDWKLWKMNLSSEGFPIELFATPDTIVTQFLLQQYRCRLPDRLIEVQPGDIVIDAGGCYGETALYFAHKTGAAGAVYSFEFMPDNIDVFRRNIALNGNLGDAIHLVDRPLWSASATKLYIEGNGPAACVTTNAQNPSTTEVSTISIDDFVDNKALPRIDFIKMDIEGAELQALMGARHCITKHRPEISDFSLPQSSRFVDHSAVD